MNIELNLEAYADLKISISDMLGREVFSGTGRYSDYSEMLDISSLNKGVYCISYEVNGQRVKSELLLIK